MMAGDQPGATPERPDEHPEHTCANGDEAPEDSTGPERSEEASEPGWAVPGGTPEPGWAAPGDTPSPPRGQAPGAWRPAPPRPEEPRTRLYSWQDQRPPQGPNSLEFRGGQQYWWGTSPPPAPAGAGEWFGQDPPAGPPTPEGERQWWSGDPSAEPFTVERARQLSPRSMVVGPINQLRSLMIPILIGLVIGGFNPALVGAAVMGVVALLVAGFVTWKTLRYEVGEERVEIRKGLIRRSRRTIPLERVRGVDVSSTLLHRMLGVAVVKIEAAAGSGASEDGKLDAVDVAEAERLRRVLLHRRDVLTGQGDDATPDGQAAAAAREGAGVSGAGGDGARVGPADDTVTYFTMPRSWYLYAVLNLGYLLTPFVVLATMFGMLQQAAGPVAGDLAMDWVAGIDQGFLVVAAVSTLVGLILLMPVFAIVSYTLTHWNFTLKARDRSLVAERGLFTRRSVTLEKRRIRGYELMDSPLERLRDAVRLRAIVTGLGEVATRAVLLPTGPRSVVEPVVEQALVRYDGGLRRHPHSAMYRRLVRAVGPFLLLMVLALALEWTWAAGVAGALAVLGVPLGLDRYRSLGHGYDGEHVSVRSGSLQRSQATVERSAVIGWTWTQSLFQRRTRLASLQVTVGAGTGGYTAQDASLTGSVAFAAHVTPEMVRPFLADPADSDQN